MLNYIKRNGDHLVCELQSMPRRPGYCFFIDIAGSTAMKDGFKLQWILTLFDTFALPEALLEKVWPPLKGIGDEFMFYVDEAGVSSIELFQGLRQIVEQHDKDYFANLKIGICFCHEVYHMTFLEGKDDVYGKDIDLTARIAHVAEEREIVMNKEFRDRLIAECEAKGENKNLYGLSEPYFFGPWPQVFKGFKSPVEIYKYRGKSC